MARIAFILLLAFAANADYREFAVVPVDPSIASRLKFAADATLKAYPNLKAGDLAITLVDVTNPSTISRADYQGDVPFYPASVIKLFFMADIYATHRENVPDAARALKEMIVVSDNDATAYLVDILADTSAGPNLEGRALKKFVEKRRDINRRFQKLGYTDNVSAMMKPWSFGPYGRELQLLGENRINRNKLTANACASLLLWIVRRRAPGAEAMMGLLQRPLAPPREDENQVKEFIGAALPPESKLWSKAGWTSEVRHDAAYLELPNGRKYVLVIFTRGIASDLTLLPAITRNVFAEMGGGAAGPTSVVDDFYKTYIANRPPGLPEGVALDRLRPYLSGRLQTLIDAALAHQKDFIKKNPSEKPPFVDGDHFSSMFEGPTSYKPLATTAQPDGTWNVSVHFAYNTEVEWEDTVVVRMDQGRYTIDDILYSGAGAFNPPGRLSDRLRP